MLDDTNWYLLYDGAFWGGTAVALVLWWIPTGIAAKALRGTWRSWVLAPPIPFQISSRNTWPFMVAAVSASMTIALLSLPAEVLNWEQTRQAVWNAFFIPWAFVVLSFVWWPLALSPRWYRAWAGRGGTRETSPWTADEVAAVEAARPSKLRDKRLADIARCRAALEQDASPGEDADTPQKGPRS